MPWYVEEFSIEPPTRDERRTLRRKVQLESEVSSSGITLAVVMLDLSEAGMMINTQADLAVDEILQVELPEFGLVKARIAWKRPPLFGCEFLSPATKAAISAVLLKSGSRSNGAPESTQSWQPRL